MPNPFVVAALGSIGVAVVVFIVLAAKTKDDNPYITVQSIPKACKDTTSDIPESEAETILVNG